MEKGCPKKSGSPFPFSTQPVLQGFMEFNECWFKYPPVSPCFCQIWLRNLHKEQWSIPQSLSCNFLPLLGCPKRKITFLDSPALDISPIRFYGNPKARTRKVAIWARLTSCNGQKLPLPQPDVIPSAANCFTHGA